MTSLIGLWGGEQTLLSVSRHLHPWDACLIYGLLGDSQRPSSPTPPHLPLLWGMGLCGVGGIFELSPRHSCVWRVVISQDFLEEEPGPEARAASYLQAVKGASC